MAKAKVAALKVRPETILRDVVRLCELAGIKDALAGGATTILKDNISWHYPFPAANTTPWQLEGTILALKAAGLADITCVQNKTVVTNAFKGEDLNHYVPIFKQYGIPVLYNFKDEDMKWIEYRPKARMHVLDRIFPDGIKIPDYFAGKNIIHLPTMKCVAGDTQVVLADGSVATIASLFERATRSSPVQHDSEGAAFVTSTVEVASMVPTGEVAPRACAFISRSRIGERRVARLSTRSGRTLVASADHRIRTPSGWNALEELAPGNRVAVALGRDVGWDEVSQVSWLDANSEEFLYDLTVPDTECFVGNGLVLHNCHIYTTTTGAMKNAFGGLLATHRHYTHSWIHRTLVDLLAIQKEIHAGLFAVMDGTTAGNGPGPRTMYPVIKDYMLASADQVAIDAVAAKMMGFDPLSLEYISVAHADGLGVGDTRDIEVVGADVSKESWGFEVGDNAASRVGDLMWFGPLKKFQKLFFHTPLVHAFVLGSEVYHDYVRWPVSDRRTFERWCVETEWGRLFVEYGRRSGVEPPADLAQVMASAARA